MSNELPADSDSIVPDHEVSIEPSSLSDQFTQAVRDISATPGSRQGQMNEQDTQKQIQENPGIGMAMGMSGGIQNTEDLMTNALKQIIKPKYTMTDIPENIAKSPSPRPDWMSGIKNTDKAIEVNNIEAKGNNYKYAEGGDVSSVVPDSEVSFNPNISAPEVEANSREAQENEVSSRHGKFGALGAAAEGAASSATFGASTKAETALGISTPEEIRQRAEDFPKSHVAGELAGLLTPGAPEAKALTKAGELASTAVRGSGFLSRVGRTAVKGAVENAMFQAGDEVSKSFSEDPNQTAQTAITDIGLSSLLGGAIGTGFGVVPELFNKSGADKFVTDMSNRFKEHLTNPELPTQAADNLADFHADTNAGTDSLYKGDYSQTGERLPNVKDQAIQQLVPEMNTTIQDKGIGEVTNHVADKIEKMKADTDTYLPKFTKALESDFSKWQEVANNPEAKSADIFKATEDLKRTLQTRSKIGIPIDNTNPAFDSIKELKNTANYLKKSLEDESVWGKAGEFQKNTNKAFTDFLSPLKDFNRSFAQKIGDEYKVDPDKVNSYLNQVSKEKGSIKSEKLQNYLKAADEYRSTINQAHENIGIAGPFEKQSTELLGGINSKLSHGSRAADSIVKTILHHGAGEAAGAVGGSMFGWPGYMVGKHVAGPVLDSVIPKLIKPVLGSAADGTAFKAAVDYIGAFSKGETQINRGINNLFKAGKEVLPSTLMPSEKDRSKLDKQLKDLASNPEPMTNIGGKTGHYLPDHGQALSQTSMAAVNYLNSQRPEAVKVSPLDKQPSVDPMQKAQWNRTLNIAEQPLVALSHIKEGTLQPNDVKTITTLYPGLYQKLSSNIVTELSERTDKSDPIPYRTKMGMSLFLGHSLDSTMLPQAIIAAQPQPAQQPQQQATKKPTAASAKSMEKVAQSNMTPQQLRQAQHSGSAKA